MNLDSFIEICHKPLGNKGEDAFAYDLRRDDVHALAVFDGCGGAGAWKYPEYRNATGAFIAAHSMAGSFYRWIEKMSAADTQDSEGLAFGLSEVSGRTLSDLKQSCSPMGVAGSLVKSFPCTVSAAVLTPDPAGGLALTALSVGDSRVYILTPETGLLQVTKDDSRGHPDPLDSLRENAPLSDMLNADKPYKIKHRRIRLQTPFAVMCATDGIFGFARSPMDFEYQLLEALDDASSFAEFEDRLKETVMKTTGDDCTCLMAFYGWKKFDRLRKDLRRRSAYVKTLVKMIDETKDAAGEDAVIREIWKTYKTAAVLDEMKV